MNMASNQARITTAFALLLVAVLIALAVYAPSVRHTVLKTLGIKEDSKLLAVNSCPLAQDDAVADSDNIYFLSCGGIY